MLRTIAQMKNDNSNRDDNTNGHNLNKYSLCETLNNYDNNNNNNTNKNASEFMLKLCKEREMKAKLVLGLGAA